MAQAKPTFVYERTWKRLRKGVRGYKEKIISQTPLRLLQNQYELFWWEQIRRFDTIQAAKKAFPKAWPWLKKDWTGLTKDGRKRIAAAKRGKKNPNAGGLSVEHKRKISVTLKAHDRRQIRNPFYGHKHTETARAIMSAKAKKRRFQWVMEPGGKAHRMPLDFVLPDGWRRGNGGFRYATRRILL